MEIHAARYIIIMRLVQVRCLQLEGLHRAVAPILQQFETRTSGHFRVSESQATVLRSHPSLRLRCYALYLRV